MLLLSALECGDLSPLSLFRSRPVLKSKRCQGTALQRMRADRSLADWWWSEYREQRVALIGLPGD
jgi:hypothetical protein